MKTFIFTLCLLGISPDIVMRHDVEEARYFELAEKYGGSTVRLNAGCGTFIRPNWILTAAHVASGPWVGEDVTIDGVKYKIKRKIIHPDYGMARHVINDIALLELEKNVPDAKLAKLYQKSDEIGKEIIFAGTGWAGTGDKGMAEGAIIKDRKMRAAQNLIDGSKAGYLRFTFDAPGTKNSLPLEGISGPGDSGGPALWIEGDEAWIMGVSSHQDGHGTGKPEGVYGVYEYYARVSEYYDWIIQVIES